MKPGLRRQLESQLATGSLEMEARVEQENKVGPGSQVEQQCTGPKRRAEGGLGERGSTRKGCDRRVRPPR